jgi:hypothetical protein
MLTPLQQQTRYKVQRASEQYGVPTSLATAVNKIESSYGANTGPSSAGALGPMQIMPATAAQIARDHNKQFGTAWTQQQVLTDPDTNIAAGVYYLSQGLQGSGGDINKALFRYNPSSRYVRDVLSQSNIESQQQSQQGDAKVQNMATLTPQIQQQSSVLQPIPVSSPTEQTDEDIAFVSESQSLPFNLQTQRAQQLQQHIAKTQQSIETGSQRQLGVSDFGTGAKILATIAAFAGNFGPAMMIMEQERKTALFKQMEPGLHAVEKLRIAGKYDEAVDAANNLMSTFGGRAPEIAPYMQRVMDRVTKDQEDVRNLKTFVDMHSPLVGKDDIRRPMMDSLKAAAKAGTPFAKELLADVAKKLDVQSNVTPGGVVMQHIPGSTQIQQQPLQVAFDTDLLKTPAGLQLQQQLRMTPDNISKMMRGFKATDTSGNVVFDPADRSGRSQQNLQQAQQQFTQLQQNLALQDMYAKTPRPPEANQYLYGLRKPDGSPMYTVQQVASGQIAPEHMAQSIEIANQRSYMQSTGQRQADLDVPSGVSQAGRTVIDRATGADRPDLSLRQAFASPQQFAAPTAAQAPMVKAGYKLLNRLQGLVEVINELPNINDPLSRAPSWLSRRLNQVVNMDADLKGQEALQTIAKAAIEEYFNARNIPASRYESLTSALTTPGADKQGALRTLQKLAETVRTDLDLFVTYGDAAPLPQRPVEQGVPTSTTAPAQIMQPVPGTGRR